MVEKQNTEQFKKKILENNVTVAEFYTDWCPTCKTMAMLFEGAARQWSQRDPRVEFVKINVEEEPALMKDYQIRSVPVVTAFRRGETVERHTGVIGSRPLNEMIERALRS